MFYFAYGLLTDQDYMSELGAEFVSGAGIRGYKLELFDYANLVRDGGSTSVGALWNINDQVLSRLDLIEGYPVLYTRSLLPVLTQGRTVNAWVYTMTVRTREKLIKDPEAYPTNDYIQTMYRGYKDAGVSTKSIDMVIQETITRIENLQQEKKQ